MLNIERLDEILDYLKKYRSASVSNLSKKLHIGEATIRRDLEKLQSNGFVKRTYGGVVLVEGLDSEIPLYVREKDNIDAKNMIGRLAANLIQENSICILDSSSTTYHMIEYLKNRKNLTIITNGAKTAVALGQLKQSKIFSTGGKLREFSLSYIGNTAQSFVENFYVDKLFFSCRALSIEKGILDSSEEEAELRKVMLNHCNQAILLVDDTKFDNTAFYKICDLNIIDVIVTNKKLDLSYENFFITHDIKIISP